MGGDVLRLPPAPDAIEVRHLRAFVAVAEELNFGRAATRLYVTQPALSRQIGSLERMVGCQLLRRSTRTVELTLAGDVLLGRARDLLKDLNEAVTMTRSIGDELLERITRTWAPVTELTVQAAEFDDIRSAYESVTALFPVPDGIDVRPVNAGGVFGLSVSPNHELPPSVLYLHGGGMVLGSAYGYRSLAGALAAAAGATVVVPDFRLAPEHPYPAALDDAVRAYEWLLGRGLAPEEVSICGDSMGGSLALTMLLRLKRDDLPLPGRIVLLSPGFGLTPPGQLAPGEAEPFERFADAYLAGHPSDDPLVNPLLGDFTGLPPMLVQAAISDFAFDHAERLADHARGNGVDVEFDTYPIAAHVFHLFWPLLPEAVTAIEKAGEYLRSDR